MTILHYLENTAVCYPTKPAVVDEKGQYTFSELRALAISIAARIQNRLDAKRHQPIMVYLPKGKECVAAFMGIVYSGNIYTPTDVRFPFPKVQSIIDVLNPVLYISDRKNTQTLQNNGIANEHILIYDDIETSDFDVKKTLSKTIDTDPVYIFFTSGSTGIPKGVIINHRNIIDYIEWAVPACSINETTIIGNQSAFYFDISTQDIYSCIKTAATLVVIPERFFSFPIQVLKFIKEKNINYLYWVPSAFINVCSRDALYEVDISCVKQIIFGGEVMPVKYLKKWQKHIPGLQAMNVYGPTEATVNITAYQIDRDFGNDEILPLGMPCGNTDLIVIDDNNDLVTNPFIKGELCARGTCLSPGYWRNNTKTTEVFVQNPLHSNYHDIIYRTGDLVHYNGNGELVFDGRKDFQIKHLGYRIELGEIETAVSVIESVETVSADYDKTKQEIVLFYSGRIDEKELKVSLLKQLPKYMVPTKYVKLDSFPYNDNGKIDRKRLREKYMEKIQ